MLKNNENFLLENAVHGSPAAFKILFFKYKPRVKRLVSQYVKNPQDADDIVQSVFIKAFQGLKRFRGDCAFFTWLFSITMNCIKNDREGRMKIGRELVYLVEVDDHLIDQAGLLDEDDPEAICIARESIIEITKLIDDLPSFLKMVLLLRENEGMPYDEIAARVGCPIGTVRSRIHRVRSEMRKILEKE